MVGGIQAEGQTGYEPNTNQIMQDFFRALVNSDSTWLVRVQLRKNQAEMMPNSTI
jgi:hypothetical protein